MAVMGYDVARYDRRNVTESAIYGRFVLAYTMEGNLGRRVCHYHNSRCPPPENFREGALAVPRKSSKGSWLCK